MKKSQNRSALHVTAEVLTVMMTPVPPYPTNQAYPTRRQRIAEALGDGVLILASGDEKIRSNDTHYRFRPDSNFAYLTGVHEPGAVWVFRPGHDPQQVLFLPPVSEKQKQWDGPKLTPEQAQALSLADQAFPLQELKKRLPKLLNGAEQVFFPFTTHPQLEQSIFAAIEHLQRHERRGKRAPLALKDARALLGEARMIKDEWALQHLSTAVEISSKAHLAAMQFTKPGVFEYQIEATLLYHFRMGGSNDPAYLPIVGCGNNATILHYHSNTSQLLAGQLLLVDAGAEVDLFSADITRTYPVSGRFSPAQRDLYEIVLAANLAGIQQCKVGQTLNHIHRTCLQVLCTGLRDLGLVERSKSIQEIIADKSYKRYYMHKTSHWLGADVHDAGYYRINHRARPLQPGFVLTVEPGLYIREDDEQAPKELRGCGIRIEDDILVGSDGPDVLSAHVPKQVAELEANIGCLGATIGQ